MVSVVVPFRAEGKTRLPEEIRADLARAMLADVVAAALALGRVLVVGDEADAVPPGAEAVADPGGGQGVAVAAGLALVDGHVLVVNADLPCVTADALRRLAASVPALVAAADGTTNAISLPDPSCFEPLYGPGSAARFAATGLAPVAIPELELDVDTLADLDGLALDLGRRTDLTIQRHGVAPARGR